MSQYKNPILFADFNNPEVLRDGEDFYLIAPTHHFMGMTVLHSQDMVHWTYLSRVYSRIDLHPRYSEPGQGYQHGSWAPCLVKHHGLFYIYFISPWEGIYVTTAEHPKGPWAPLELMHQETLWEDPYPFWDDDGQAWFFHGGSRLYPLRLHKMSQDGKQLLDEGFFVLDEPALKGPRVMKRNGFYYIFVAGKGMHTGEQLVFRSRSIKGPYEKRILLQQGESGIPGPRQGPFVESTDGRWWFYHQITLGGLGRPTLLQPAGWGEDDWPWIGVNQDADGVGEPVHSYELPLTPVPGEPATSDDFDQPGLGLQWYWNHNPVDEAWSLTERPGWLRLQALDLVRKDGRAGAGGDDRKPVPFREDCILFAHNTLAQRPFGEHGEAVTCMDLRGFEDGQRAGLSLFNQHYLWIGVAQDEGERRIVFEDFVDRVPGPSLAVQRDLVWLRVVLYADVTGTAEYSLDGEHFEPLGRRTPFRFEWFESLKYALFCYNHLGRGGYADFDYMRCRRLSQEFHPFVTPHEIPNPWDGPPIAGKE